jgi:hypothetical protein
MAGKHGGHNCWHPAEPTAAEPELGLLVAECQHPAAVLNDYVNIYLGERHPLYKVSTSLLYVLLFLSLLFLLYICLLFKKDA